MQGKAGPGYGIVTVAGSTTGYSKVMEDVISQIEMECQNYPVYNVSSVSEFNSSGDLKIRGVVKKCRFPLPNMEDIVDDRVF